MLISRTLWWILAVAAPVLVLATVRFFRGRPTSARNAVGALGVLGGCAAGVYLWFFSHDVLYGRERAGRIEVTRMQTLGHPLFHDARIGEGDYEVWVVNDTTSEMTAGKVAGERSSGWQPVRIPPGTVGGVKFAIRYIGPEAKPAGPGGWLSWRTE